MDQEVSPEEIELGLAIQSALEKAEAKQAELQAQLARANDLQKRLARSLAALTGPSQPQAGPRKDKRQGGSRLVSETIEQRILDAMRQYPDGATVKNLAATLAATANLHATSVNRGLTQLRKKGTIRKAGVAEGTNNAFLYKLMEGDQNGAT